MNNVLFPIPIYKINGIDARTSGEWPGKLPCHFKSSKLIIKPPDNDLFPQVSVSAVIKERPKKKQIIKEASKEYVFKPSSKPIALVKHIEKSHSVKIFPNAYGNQINVFEDKSYGSRSIDKEKGGDKGNREHKRNKLVHRVNYTKEELHDIVNEELKMMMEHAKMQKIFKQLPNRDLLKMRMRGNREMCNELFKSQYHIDTSKMHNWGFDMRSIDGYFQKATKVFESKLPKVNKK